MSIKKTRNPQAARVAYRPDYECKDKGKKRGHTYTPSLLHNKKRALRPKTECSI